MVDKGHCMMPFEDDTEFEAFYDFSRQYRDLPQTTKAITASEDSEFNQAEERKIEKDQQLLDGGKAAGEDGDESDDWATEDEEDADEIEEANSADEEDSSGKPTPSSEQEEAKSEGFEVI